MTSKRKILIIGGLAVAIIFIVLIVIYGTGDLFKASLQLPTKPIALLDSDRTGVKKPTPPKDDPVPVPVPTPPAANVGSGSGGGGGPLPRRQVKRTPSTETTATLKITEQKAAFSDTANHKFKEAINYIAAQGIVTGYPDGLYKANNTLNRAEMLKIVILAMENKNARNVSLSFHM